MNFNLSELENLFEKINIIIDDIDKTKFYDREFHLFLANGDFLKYNIPKDAIPHLLGIEIPYLINTNLFNETDSYKLLKLFLENPYKIYTAERNGILKYEKIFSPYIQTKIDYFKENIKIDIAKTEFVCEYKKSRTFHTGENKIDCSYIIVKKYYDGKIGFLVLAKNGNYYVPKSSRIYNSLDEAEKDFKEFFLEQVLTILTGGKSLNKIIEYEASFGLSPNEVKKKANALEKEYKKNIGQL